jgi:hypothetical protein
MHSDVVFDFRCTALAVDRDRVLLAAVENDK